MYRLVRENGVDGGLEYESWAAHHDWAIWDNPYAGDLPFGVALRRDSRLMGLAGFLYMPFYVDDWEGVACNLGAICLDPSLRGLDGLKFVRQSAKRAPTPLHYASHMNKELGAIWRRIGAKPGIGTDVTYRRTVAPVRRALRWSRNAVTRRLGVDVGPSVPATSALEAPDRRTVAKDCAYSLLPATALDDGWLDALWYSARDETNMGIRRDAAFLRWRYEAHPKKDMYHWISVESGNGDGLPALVILSVNRSNGLASIAEMIVPADRRDRDDVVMRAAMDAARHLGASVLQSKAVSPRWTELWARHGFRADRTDYCAWLYFDRRDSAADVERAPWFTFGDSRPV